MTVDWGSQIDYLKATRELYYNDDYLAFLVQTVWKLNKPIKIIDFGCGYGYLGLKLLPLLPEGSSYTGLDSDATLINQARHYFNTLPYNVTFKQVNLEEVNVEQSYDLALSHAFLLHISKPASMLKKMKRSLVKGGRMICFEPHWIAGMANQYGEGIDPSSIIPLGIYYKGCMKIKRVQVGRMAI